MHGQFERVAFVPDAAQGHSGAPGFVSGTDFAAVASRVVAHLDVVPADTVVERPGPSGPAAFGLNTLAVAEGAQTELAALRA